ncbi:MAG: hypothetical protein AAF468_12735 [Pseudomonadota bacterium]
MNPIDALNQLGYSAINLALVFAVAALFGFLFLRNSLTSRIKKYAYIIVFVILYLVAASYLAPINKALSDAYRANEAEKTEKSE